MSHKFGDVLYVSSPYRPEPGSFCKPNGIRDDKYRAGEWYYCRELFHRQLRNLNLFFFSHDSEKGCCIAAFMQRVEDLLDVQPRSDFGPTQRKTIMWVEPSRWWTAKAMRRSLFTILLRAGSEYSPEKDNFDEALFSDPYTMSTKYAVNRFLDGNTIYIGKKYGWYKQFYENRPTKEEIDSLLVPPY
jgi:hypothetical protein